MDSADALSHWPRYEPSSAAPWNRRRAVHLHRCAGYAATWGELERDLSGSPQEAVGRLCAGQSRLVGVPADFEATATMLSEAASGSNLDRRLKAAWVYRMVFSPDPLGERLTLMWHGHFATSNRKVQNLKQMQDQNDALRRHARAPFGELLKAAVQSPAMLVWLDADKNSTAHPNENLARELLELFTLGIGNYTEADVQQAARALTSWRVVGDAFRFDPTKHDAGEKTIFGSQADFNGDSLLTLALAQPATARRVAWRLCRTFLGEGAADDAAIDSLATGLREQNLNIGWGVQTILSSERFFAENNLGNRIVGPPEYVVGSVRALECFAPPPSTLLLADWMARMGQDLYYPPNVGGWEEGRGWLASGSIVSRANFAAALAAGRLNSTVAAPQLAELISRHCGEVPLESGVAWLGELLYGGLPKQAVQHVTQEATRRTDTVPATLATALVMLLSRSEAHLA